MLGVERRQAGPEPFDRDALEPRGRVLEVGPVFGTQVPRLVQELNLRRQIVRAVGRGAQGGGERPSDRGLATKDPFSSVRIIEQQLELPMRLADAPAPQGIDRTPTSRSLCARV